MNIKYINIDLKDELAQISDRLGYFDNEMIVGIVINGTKLNHIYTYINVSLNDNIAQILINLHRYNNKLHMLGYDNLIFKLRKSHHYYGESLEITCYMCNIHRLPDILTIPKDVKHLILGKIKVHNDLKEINIPDNINIVIESDSYEHIRFNNINNIKRIDNHVPIGKLDLVRRINAGNYIELNNLEMDEGLKLYTFKGLKKIKINENCNLTKINCSFIEKMDIILNRKVTVVQINNYSKLEEINVYTPLEELVVSNRQYEHKGIEIITMDDIQHSNNREKLRHFKIVKNK